MAINTAAPLGLREGLMWRSKSSTPIIGGGVVAVQYGATAAIASSTTETTLWDTAAAKMNGTLTLPAGFLKSGVSQYVDQPTALFLTSGAVIRVKMSGLIGNTGTPNITIKAALNAAGPVQKLLSSTTAKATLAITGAATWQLEYTSVVSAYSATVGSVVTQGLFSYATATTGTVTHLVLPTTSLGSLDLSAAYDIDTTVTWGTSDPANTITMTFATVEILS